MDRCSHMYTCKCLEIQIKRPYLPLCSYPVNTKHLYNIYTTTLYKSYTNALSLLCKHDIWLCRCVLTYISQTARIDVGPAGRHSVLPRCQTCWTCVPHYSSS